MPSPTDYVAPGDPGEGVHLSIIAVSRNDDHGGDMRVRMQHFVDGFIAQCRRHGLVAELILVEWNPPLDRPPLEDALAWPDDFGPAKVRIVTVPADVHAEFPHSAALPLFQMIGKNVGIRRARGRFVLSTNVDILFDDAMIRYLRDQPVPGAMLRADRYDVPSDLPCGVAFEQVLADCRARLFQINTRFGIFDVQRRRIVVLGDGIEARLLAAYTNARIFGVTAVAQRLGQWTVARIGDATSSLSTAVARWVSAIGVFFQSLGLGVMAAVSALPYLTRRFARKFQPWDTMSVRVYWFFRRWLRRSVNLMRLGFRLAAGKVLALSRAMRSGVARIRDVTHKAWRFASPLKGLWRRSVADVRLARSQRLHTWACGDFTLLAREDWFRLRGYPEWAMYSWHIDSAFMFAANAHDIREVALGPRYRIYHIDHSVGSGWSPAGQSQLFGRLTARGIPYMSNEELVQWQARVAENPASAIVNGPAWGLADRDLPEREILPRGRKIVLSSPSETASAATPA